MKKILLLIMVMIVLIAQNSSAADNYIIVYDGLERTLTKIEGVQIIDNSKDQQKKDEIERIERALERREHYKGAENLYKYD